MKTQFALVVTLALSSCASIPPQETEAGGPVDIANAVLAAANNYVRVKGRAPTALSELVPSFMNEIPSEPKLNYDAKRKLIYFEYSAIVDSREVDCGCQASLGQKNVYCNCVL